MFVYMIGALIALLFVLFGSLFFIKMFAQHNMTKDFLGFFKGHFAKLFR